MYFLYLWCYSPLPPVQRWGFELSVRWGDPTCAGGGGRGLALCLPSIWLFKMSDNGRVLDVFRRPHLLTLVCLQRNVLSISVLPNVSFTLCIQNLQSQRSHHWSGLMGPVQRQWWSQYRPSQRTTDRSSNYSMQITLPPLDSLFVAW